MTTGGPTTKGPLAGTLYSILRQLNEQQKLGLTDQQIYQYYIDLKNAYQQNNTEIITSTEEGARSLSPLFLTDFVKYATTGQNPYTATGTPSTTGIPKFTSEDTSGGLTKREREQRRQNTKASWAQFLVNYGLDPNNANLQALISEATRNRYNDARFLEYLRKTPEYQARFRGIMDENGVPRMTESQYLALDRQFESVVTGAGLNYSDGLKAFLFKNDVSLTEVKQRAGAVKQLMQNESLFTQFGKELVAKGIARPGEITKKNLMRFAMGEGSREWTNLWQDAAARNAAVEAGLKIVKGSDLYSAINRQQILEIADKGYSVSALAEGFQSVADQFLNTMSLSEARRYNLKKEDILQATFGGPRSAQARQKIRRVLETNEAFSADRAAPQVYSSAERNVNVLGSTDDKEARSGY